MSQVIFCRQPMRKSSLKIAPPPEEKFGERGGGAVEGRGKIENSRSLFLITANVVKLMFSVRNCYFFSHPGVIDRLKAEHHSYSTSDLPQILYKEFGKKIQ